MASRTTFRAPLRRRHVSDCFDAGIKCKWAHQGGGDFSSKKRGPVLIMCLRFLQAGEVSRDFIHTSLTESVKCGFAACYCRPNASQKRDKRGSGGRGQTGWLDLDRHLSCSFVSFCPVSTPSPGSTWRAPGQFTSPGLTGSKGRGAQCKSCRHFDSSLMMALSRYLFRRPCAECRKQHSFHMEPFPHLSHFSCYFSL